MQPVSVAAAGASRVVWGKAADLALRDDDGRRSGKLVQVDEVERSWWVQGCRVYGVPCVSSMIIHVGVVLVGLNMAGADAGPVPFFLREREMTRLVSSRLVSSQFATPLPRLRG